ncbi:MAG: thrombospondin type 3 repeat-containing protein [Patescibacteria group bacterium]|nr:thrombospondin type 3 repeat-containing protein [Patescibacteria group bacterium]
MLRKKIIFLLLFFAVIIAITLAVFFLNKKNIKLTLFGFNKPPVSTEQMPKRTIGQIKNDFIEKFEQEAEEIKIKNREFLKKQKNSKTRKKFIIAKHYNLIKEDCEKIQDKSLKEDCYYYLNFKDIIKKENIQFCNSLDDEWRDMCIYQISIITMNNWEDCQKIKDGLIHDMCLKKFAIDLNDILICPRLYSGVNACVDRVRSLNNADGDIKNCKEIIKTEYFLNCVMKSNDDCSELEDEYLIDKCESIRFFGLIMTRGTKEECAILPLEEYRKTCELYFDNNKTHTDFDGDGVDNNIELFCDTNPLIAEEEAKEHAWYEERWSAVFDNIYYITKSKLYDLTIDTDNDGLRDYEEKKIYLTDYNNPDTDGDGYSDGEEVKAGYNPNGKGSL